MNLIGLAGHAGVGKDTVADILVADHSFKKFSFSDALYEEVSHAFHVPIPWLQDREVKDKPQPHLFMRRCNDPAFVAVVRQLIIDGEEFNGSFSPRQILQWWGTEYRRAKDPLYWVRRAGATVREERERNPRVRMVNTSVRFPNELDFIRGLGGEVWGIKRDVPRPNGHPAENGVGVEGADRLIDNTGSIDNLRALLRDITWDRA